MLLFPLLVFLAAAVYYVARDPLRYRWHRRRFEQIIGLEQRFKNQLVSSFPYYNRLSAENKIEFERRLQYVISTKDFYTFDGLDLTDDIIALSAASAVQLTFGFKQFWMPNVKAVLVYPSSFQRYKGWPKFRGEYSERGYIRLSWHHFQHGYLEPRDGVNLGLHEMAHALMHLHELRMSFDEFNGDELLYDKLASMEMLRVRNKENGFLRGYAGTNKDEMFAVCVEYFFEVPDLFQRELPELYDAISRLLNQDPARSHEPVWVR